MSDTTHTHECGLVCLFCGKTIKEPSGCTCDEAIHGESVHGMVKRYLMQHGYEGLFNPDGECGCSLEDLSPCSEMSEHCRAGYRHDGDPTGNGWDFYIHRKKCLRDIGCECKRCTGNADGA